MRHPAVPRLARLLATSSSAWACAASPRKLRSNRCPCFTTREGSCKRDSRKDESKEMLAENAAPDSFNPFQLLLHDFLVDTVSDTRSGSVSFFFGVTGRFP